MPWGSSLFPLLIVTSSGRFTGLFVYSPAPGNGNLIASITASSGTDPFGNSFNAGITSYTHGGGLLINELAGTLSFNDTLAADPLVSLGLMRLIHTTASGQSPILALDAPAADTNTTHSSLWLLGAPPGALTGPVQAAFFADNHLGGFAGQSPLELIIALGAGGRLTFGGISSVTGTPAPNTAMWLAPSGDTTGATDTAAINTAYSVQNYHHIILLPGTFYVNAPLQVPASAALRGIEGDVYGAAPLTGTVIKAAATWAQGGAPQPAIVVPTGAGTELADVSLDLSALAGTVYGFHTNGQNNGLVRNVAIWKAPNHGVADGGLAALTWRFQTVYVNTPGAFGWALAGGISDSTFIDCSVISATQHGWSLFNMGNSKWIGCRAEFCGFTGMIIDGTLGSPGMGNVQIIGFSTDRNALEGIRIIATGNAPVLISGTTLRRDSSSNPASPTNAAINYQSAKCPVLIDGLTVQPGVNDDGTGTLTPTAGINYTPFGAGASFLQVVNALLWVATGGTPLQGTSPDVTRAITTVAAAVNTQPLVYTKIVDNA